jgi:hypothetical protein
MSVMQKLNIAALVTGLLALGWYLVRVLPQLGGDVAAIAWQWPMAISLLAFIVMITVAAILIAVTDADLRADPDRLDDERDRAFERRGDAWAGHVLQAFVLVALVLLMFGQPAFWVANMLYTGVMIGGMAGLVIRLSGYKGG